MKLSRIYLIAILLMTFGVAAKSQEPPKAVLIDEFGKLQCEDVIARQDYLFAELQKAPMATGLAIIFADSDDLKRARQTEAMFNGQTEFREFDDARFRIVRANGSDGLKVQLWLIPPGASLPQFTKRDRDFEIDPKGKAFKVNASEYDEGPCPIGSQFKLYSKTLKANPHAKGHIVIWARHRTQFLKEKARVDRDLLTKYNIASSQVRYFYFPHRSSDVEWEYWIVPNKNK